MADDRDYLPSSPPPKSSSNWLWWVLGIAALTLLLCCGGGGIVLWRLGEAANDFVANMTTSDPAEIRRQTAQMVDIDIPERFQPMQGMNVVAMRMVMYQATSEEGGMGTLTLMQMTMDQAGVDKEQQEAELRKSMQQRGGQGFESSESETRTIEIRGEEVPFMFSEGTNSMGGQQQTTHTVSGVFRGKEDRPVMLQLTLPDEAYDEAEVMAMLESIE